MYGYLTVQVVKLTYGKDAFGYVSIKHPYAKDIPTFRMPKDKFEEFCEELKKQNSKKSTKNSC